ncbi:MAG: hypothetical protein ACR2OR_01300 [Hyphomicrobiales bacterium]
MQIANKLFVAATCPLRNINFDAVDEILARKAAAGRLLVVQEALSEATKWNFATAEAEFRIGDVIEVEKIGFGLVLLQVDLLKKLIEKGLASEFPRFGAITQTNHPVYDFFSPLKKEDGSYIFEDIAFCNRVSEAGETLYALVTEDVQHWGDYAYKGRLPRG